jgi:hypothetical protein
MPRLRCGIVPVVVCALAAGGCGSGGTHDSTPRVSAIESKALVAQLERARLTAAAQDLAGTKVALNGFKLHVARLRRAGALSDATARRLRIGASRALARAASDSAAVVQPPVTPAPAAPVLPPGQAKKDHKHYGGDNQGGGNNQGGGEGGD